MYEAGNCVHVVGYIGATFYPDNTVKTTSGILSKIKFGYHIETCYNKNKNINPTDACAQKEQNETAPRNPNAGERRTKHKIMYATNAMVRTLGPLTA